MPTRMTKWRERNLDKPARKIHPRYEVGDLVGDRTVIAVESVVRGHRKLRVRCNMGHERVVFEKALRMGCRCRNCFLAVQSQEQRERWAKLR